MENKKLREAIAWAEQELIIGELGFRNEEELKPLRVLKDFAIQSLKRKIKDEDKEEYAELVHMTEEQYQKLVAEYGDKAAKRMIEILDGYKGAKGKTYKDDYRAIKNWVVDRFNQELTRRPSAPTAQITAGPRGLPQSVKDIMGAK